MPKKTDIDTLAELPLEEIEERIQPAAGRVEQRIQRCQAEERDLSERESDLCSDDRLELSALKDALQLRRRNAERRRRVGGRTPAASRTTAGATDADVGTARVRPERPASTPQPVEKLRNSDHRPRRVCRCGSAVHAARRGGVGR